MDQLPATFAAKQSDIDRKLADIAQALAQNEVERTSILRAPADGVVASIVIHPGQAVGAQQSLLTVLPAPSKLLAELWVPSKAIGFIHTDEPVVIRYLAYPYQKFGLHAGKVIDVSRSALPIAEVSRLLGKDVKEQRYRVRVALANQDVLAYGIKEPLKPGMALDADIILDQRPLIDWILDPFLGLSTRLHEHALTSNHHVDI